MNGAAPEILFVHDGGPVDSRVGSRCLIRTNADCSSNGNSRLCPVGQGHPIHKEQPVRNVHGSALSIGQSNGQCLKAHIEVGTRLTYDQECARLLPAFESSSTALHCQKGPGLLTGLPDQPRQEVCAINLRSLIYPAK